MEMRKPFLSQGENGNTHNCLTTNWADLNLDVDNSERFGADVYLYQTWVYWFVELAKSWDKTNGTWKESKKKVSRPA